VNVSITLFKFETISKYTFKKILKSVISLVELYEKGYGKDAAGIAMEAINYARMSKIDVVLVDTAGRMQVSFLSFFRIFEKLFALRMELSFFGSSSSSLNKNFY